MNGDLDIDEKGAFAVLEPGVRWVGLYDATRPGRKAMAIVRGG